MIIKQTSFISVFFYLGHGHHHHHAGGRGGHHHHGGGGNKHGSSGGVSIWFLRNKIIDFFPLNRNLEVVNKVQQLVPMVEDNNLSANNSRQINEHIYKIKQNRR